MKSYREIADKVFERRDKYLVAKKLKKKKIIKRTSAALCALVVVLGLGAWHLGWFRDKRVTSYSQSGLSYEDSGGELNSVEITSATTTTTRRTTTTTTKKTTTTTQISTEDFPDESVWDTIKKGVYTSQNGGVQITARGWRTHDLYGVRLIPSQTHDFLRSASIRIGSTAPGQKEPNLINPVLGFNPKRTFSAAEKQKFNKNGAGSHADNPYVKYDYFEKTTISSRGKTYTCFKYAYEEKYYWTFQTDYYLYTIGFCNATSMNAYPDYDMKEVGEKIMKTIVIYY